MIEKKTDKNILIAFILNLSFSILEVLGGIFTNSISIISDAIHDFGDATSIGISYFLERKSKSKPDSKYTYGYARYSVLGALITTVILVSGSIMVIVSSINRFFNPVEINYNGMLVIAILGVIINLIAAYKTKEGDSLNQSSINLHMLEDVLGWGVILIGSILIKFTNITYIDSIMSIGTAIFILVHSIKNLKSILDLFLEKTPNNIEVDELKEHLLKINDVKDVHHIHVWSLDGYMNYATLHVVTDSKDTCKIKHEIREELKEHKIVHATIELEETEEQCSEINCDIKPSNESGHYHHHH